MKTKILKLMLCALAALPLGAWADDPVTINGFREWFFDVKSDGAIAAANETVTSLTNYDGIYLRATSSHSLTYSASPSASGNITLSDDSKKIYTRTIGLKLSGNSSYTLSSNIEPNASITDATDRCMALKTGVAGKLYIVYAPTANADNRTIVLYKNGSASITHTVFKTSSSEGYSSATNPKVVNEVCSMECDAAANDIFYFGGYANPWVYYVRFIPTGTTDPNLVKSTTTWTFDQYVAGADVAGNSGAKTTMNNMSGLCFHASISSGKNRFANAASFTLASDLSLGSYTLSAGTITSVHYNGNFNNTMTNAYNAAATWEVGGAAIEIGTAGKLYIAMAGSTSYKCYVYKDGTLYSDALSLTTGGTVYTINVASAGTFYFASSGGSWDLLAVRFEPTSEGTMTKTISITAAGYATFCAPQNYRWSTSTYSNLKAYIVSSEPTTTSVTLTPIAASEGYITVPACTGVVLAGDAGSYTLNSVETATAVGTNLLKANLASYVLPYGDNEKGYNYTLAAGPTFKHPADADATALAAGKAFLRTTVNASKSGEAHAFTLNFDDEGTTGIKSIEGALPHNNIFYDMQGRIVAQPTKGLYIVNGKKVILK